MVALPDADGRKVTVKETVIHPGGSPRGQSSHGRDGIRHPVGTKRKSGLDIGRWSCRVVRSYWYASKTQSPMGLMAQVYGGRVVVVRSYRGKACGGTRM